MQRMSHAATVPSCQPEAPTTDKHSVAPLSSCGLIIGLLLLKTCRAPTAMHYRTLSFKRDLVTIPNDLDAISGNSRFVLLRFTIQFILCKGKQPVVAKIHIVYFGGQKFFKPLEERVFGTLGFNSHYRRNRPSIALLLLGMLN